MTNERAMHATQKGLPPGWSRAVSKSTGKPYYHNHKYKITQWVPPPPPSAEPVASHYDQVALVELQGSNDTAQRSKADNWQVRMYNNWVIRGLATRLHASLCARFPDVARDGPRVLDLAGGKGGGIPKWESLSPPPAHYMLIDISAASIAAANRRVAKSFERLRPTFAGICACVTEEGASFHPPEQSHVVTCHFAMNYMAQSPETLGRVLAMAHQHVVPGGYMAIAFTNGETVQRLLASSRHGVWSNRLCDIKSTAGGRAYQFTLRPSVQNCAEFVLTYEQVETAAIKCGWVPTEFVADLTAVHGEWSHCTTRAPPLDEASKEVCGVYGYCIFEKPM